MIEQMVIVVGRQNVEHHAGEQFFQVGGDAQGRAMPAQRIRDAGVVFLQRVLLRAADVGECYDFRPCRSVKVMRPWCSWSCQRRTTRRFLAIQQTMQC